MRHVAAQRILSALVDEFGYRNVVHLLEACDAKVGKGDTKKESASTRNKNPRAKPNARNVVEALKVEDEQKKVVLMTLADEYEQKAFMPNIHNVRAFLNQQKQDTSRVKSRQQAVSAVFECLARWGTDNLRDLHIRGTYGRPKSLAVIADSIESAGRQSRI